MDNSFLILELNKPRKKLCPKLEKKVKMKPKMITLTLNLFNNKLTIEFIFYDKNFER